MTPKSEAKDRIAGLDGLRAIAILFVVVAHSFQYSTTAGAGPVEGFVIAVSGKLGPCGVRLFFAISGYLITSLFATELRTYGRNLALRMFYVRRAFRIIPPLVPYLALMAIAGSLSLLPIKANEIAGASLFYVNYLTDRGWFVGHFWSLSVEEHFYLLWPPVMALCGEKTSRVISVLVILAVAVVRPLTLARHPGEAPLLLEQTHLIIDFLAAGALLALLLLVPSIRLALSRLAKPVVLGVLVVLLVLVSSIRSAAGIPGLDSRSLQAILFSLLVVMQSLNSHLGLTRWLEHPVLGWVGRRSYSIYIWQQLFLTPLHVSLGRNLLLFVPRLIPILIVATLSYQFLERPAIRMGRALAAKLAATRAQRVLDGMDRAPVIEHWSNAG